MFSIAKKDGFPRTIVAPIEGTKAITVLILVGAGSRYETDSERGIAHFLEHMFFKGGEKFKNTKEVSTAIDSIGGEFNAFTGKEYVGYYVKCASMHKEVAFSVLSDMMLSAKFDQREIEKEKGVILEELNMYEDIPLYQIGWNFEALLFGDTPLGRDQIGTKETIRSFGREDFVNYQNKLYAASNATVIIAGDISEAEGEKLAEKYFPFAKEEKEIDFLPKKSNLEKSTHIVNKKTEQGHLTIGFEGIPFGHEDDLCIRLLAIVLGGNMSSRMFLRVREERGLCYSIRCTTDNYSDAGVLSTYAGVDLTRTEEAIKAIIDEYKLVAKEGVGEEELQKAKNYLRGTLTLKMEDSEERASFLGVQSILKNQVRSLDEIFTQIDAVNTSQMNQLAKKIIGQKCYLAAIGPFAGKEEQFEQMINF